MAPKILISVDDCAYTPAIRAQWGMWNGLADLNDYLTSECILKFVLHNAAFLLEQGLSEHDIGFLPKSALMHRVPGQQIVSPLPQADVLIITGYFGNNADLELDFTPLAQFQGKVLFFGFGLNQSNDSYESFKRSAPTLQRFGPIYCQDETTLAQVQACGLKGKLIGPLQFMLLARNYFKCADQLIVSEVRGAMLDQLIAELNATAQHANFDLAHKVRLLHYPVRPSELEPILIFEAKKLFAQYVTRAQKVITSAPYVLYLCLALGIPVRYLNDHCPDSVAQSALFERISAQQGADSSVDFEAANSSVDFKATDNFVRIEAGDLGLYQRQLLLSLIQGNSELTQQATEQLDLFWAQL